MFLSVGRNLDRPHLIDKYFMFEPKLFYQTFLTEYHKFKIIPLIKILSDLPKYEKEFFGKEFDKEDRDAYKMILKSDLRQAYFHSIETFFEILFSLDPTDKETFEDEYILFNITNSNQRKTFERIQRISTDESELSFLDKETTFQNINITVGHYLFYFGIFPNEKLKSEIFDEIKSSLDAIKYGIRIIAKDFSDREEYNSYKHGLRIIPALKQFMIAQADTMEIKMSWDLSESMSFYFRTKNPDELKMITKLFDTDRDFQMTFFCSNLIFNMVYYRRVAFYKNSIMEKEIPIPMFGKEEIEKCNSTNVKMQDLVYTVRRVVENKMKK